MFCGKCGSSITEENAFCMNCGAKIVSSQNNSSFKNQNDVEKKVKLISKKKKRTVFIFCCIFLLIISCTIYTILLFANSKIEGRYYSFFTGEGYKEFTIDENESHNGTYKYYITNDSDTFWDGIYTVDNGVVFTVDYFLGTKERYDVYKNYLVPTEYSFEGNIPKGKRFNVLCKSDYTSYEFFKNGTVILRDENGIVEGTYKRSGEVIKCNFGAKSYNLLIYNGLLNNSVLKKAK